MACKRLTNSDREFLKKRLLNPQRERIQRILNEYGERVVNPFLLDFIPKDVIDMNQKYPGLISRSRFINCHELDKDLPYSFSIPVENCFSFFNGNCEIYKALRELSETQVIVKTVKRLESQMKVFANKISCVLDQIKTFNQLKNQFPEAYSILLNDTKIKENQCDTIESLRADLFSKK